MKIDNKIVSLLMISIFLFSLNVSAVKIPQTVTNGNNTNTDSSNQPVQNSSYAGKGDIDPLVDLEVTVTIKEIRALHKIDDIGRSDFFVVVYINGEKFKSKVWWNQNYIKEPWSAILNVPDDQENVSIKIQLWDWNLGLSRICDISDNSATLLSNYDIDLVYNLKTAHWTGDYYNYPYMSWADLSGYGRLNGCDDNSI